MAMHSWTCSGVLPKYIDFYVHRRPRASTYLFARVSRRRSCCIVRTLPAASTPHPLTMVFVFLARAFLVPAVWASSSAQHTYLTTPPVLVILHQNNARYAHLVGVLDRHRLVTPVDGANQLVAGAILSQGGRPH